MICDECGVNNATIKLMTIVGDEKRERHLCGECMAKMKKQFTAVDLSSLAGLLGGFLQAIKHDEPDNEALDLTCEECGQTYETFRKTSFLGCPACYRAFYGPLEFMLNRIHGHTQHNGRVPGGTSSEISRRLRIDRLKQQLGRAIAEEAYEEAAKLRDQIRALKERPANAPKEGSACD